MECHVSSICDDMNVAAAPNSDSNKKPKLLHACVERTTRELPEEIMKEILLRLPVETLIQVRSVCKSWDSILLAPDFIQAHASSNVNKNSVYNDCLVAQYDGLVIFSRYNETRIKPPVKRLHLVGSINGLICLANKGFLRLIGRYKEFALPDEYSRFVLWNPMIGRYKEFALPEEYSRYKAGKNYRYLVGFGWDYIENDYKVVVCFIFAQSRQGAIYSSNSDSWTKLVIPSFVFPSHIYHINIPSMQFMTPSTIVKGCPYWCYSKYLPQMRSPCTTLIKFEIRTHEFRLLPKLDLALVCGKEYNFVNVKDCLAVMVYKSEILCGVESLNKSVEVYFLQEEFGVWNKMYTIGPIRSNLVIWYLVQGFKCGGEIVARSNLKILCCDPKTGEINSLGCANDSKKLSCFGYTASLVFLQGMKRVPTANLEAEPSTL